MRVAVVVLVILVCVIVLIIYRHQCLLRDRARLMHDAIRHRDFSFRLPTKGLLFGERALQEATIWDVISRNLWRVAKWNPGNVSHVFLLMKS